MKVAIAYASVVLIWATTPLAIKWSNSSVSFVSAVAARVLVALTICVLLLMILRRPLIRHRSDWLAFAAGLVGSFPNVLLIYWSAQHIPSGLAAVIFGLYPFFVGLFSWLILKENIFNVRRIVAICLALFGLAIINMEQMQLGGNALLGVLGIALSTVLFGLSSVWLKHVGAGVDPLRQSTGTLILSAPLLLVSWYVLDGNIPTDWDFRSTAGLAYAAIGGSVLGGMLFFYVLGHCAVSSVGLITFITPIVALIAGALVDGEQFSLSTVAGCVLVIVSLGVYQNALKQVVYYWRLWTAPKVTDG